MANGRKIASRKISGNRTRFHEDFSQKIKSIDEILKILGKRPRKRKVIMCHGSFDGVHVGHLRQLSFAKKFAPILVIDLLSDKHITRGDFRPWYPDNLRAYQLSSVEYVDYIIKDDNPTPIEYILKLQPDFFVKGFEHKKNGINQKTQEEIEALKTYGGKILFSPGDFVESSTEILTIKRPTIPLERLSTLMREEGITFQDLEATIKNFGRAKVLVVGDLIIDKYVFTQQQLGQSSDEDVPSVLHAREEKFVGGAGVVAKHLKALGSNVTLVTVLGKDQNAKFALEDLKKSGVEVQSFIDETRPTTLKTRYIGKYGRPIFKINTQDTRTIPDDILTNICQNIRESRVDSIICSDFRHGIFNKRTIPDIISSIPVGTIKVADSQVRTRWGNILQFKGFDLITPSEKEARWSLADDETPLRPMAQELYNTTGCKFLILTLGENGILTYRSPGLEYRELFYLESLARSVSNDVGAGDALLASATATLISSKNIVQAAIIGSVCAGLECAKTGNVPIGAQELMNEIANLEKDLK